MKPTFLELFAGAGGMSRGIEAGGFHCIGHSEIEPNARAVLRYRYPDVPLYGDVTKVTGEQTGPCDLVSFGAPCQDLSVAGKRAGLMGARSSLFFEGVRLWQETGATYALYENVMGALSSNAGKDFATVLSTLVGATIPVPADGWATGGVAAGRDAVAAWRVLDLQHFGPPQRRVRVFVLASRAGGIDPAAVLLESDTGACGDHTRQNVVIEKSVLRHPSPRQQAREGATGRAAGGVGAGGVIGIDQECNVHENMMGTLNTGSKTGGEQYARVVAWDNELNASTEAHGPLMARGKSGGDRNGVLAFHHTQDPISGDVAPAIGRTTDGMGVMAFDTTQITSPSNYSHPKVGDPCHPLAAGAHPPAVVCTTGDITHALTHEGADASEDGTGRGTPIVVGNNGMESWHERDTAITLCARDAKGANNDVVGTLDFGGHGGSYNGQDAYHGRIRAEAGRPRRLTPKEAERLMSWPDDWTRYGRKDDGTVYELSDTARYRLCGNGVGSVCVEWIGARLAAAIRKQNGHPMQEAA